MKTTDLRSKAGWLLIPAAAVSVLYFTVFSPAETSVPAESFAPAAPLPLEQTELPEPENHSIIIEIKGQVAKPGVYELPADSRIQDAVRLAGGLLPDAEDRAINLAMKVSDEMSIYVPALGEEVVVPATPAATAAAGTSGSVNLNTADETALMELPGIGPSKAAAIIAYRDESGPFQSIEQLKEVSGIGDKTYEQLQDSITVD
ncbi:hypothetical protein B0X71_07500 [Planococcus lenghuensis]|uniref:Helix-hairpin-helix DNA-binding motif class 1 domain-containing protein n=1 Tax=Planococcus lenghuensis TaxID=2213202 RepID=A0A1Q2L3J6_9BACL|nr:hypothetical protein B0X71_07500 [Planococcus lenghuensis]